MSSCGKHSSSASKVGSRYFPSLVSMTLASSTKLYTFSLTASVVPLQSKISPRLYGSVTLSYFCWDRICLLYCSPFLLFIQINRTLSPTNANKIRQKSTISFFCIRIGNFCLNFILAFFAILLFFSLSFLPNVLYTPSLFTVWVYRQTVLHNRCLRCCSIQSDLPVRIPFPVHRWQFF